MTQFVDECRREWKRLGVPEAVANEMASDLAADLAEAEAEGVPPEHVLGNAVFDARAFAASWASERGVVPPGPPPERFTRRSRKLSVVLALAALIAIGVGLVAHRASDQLGPVKVVAAAPHPAVQVRVRRLHKGAVQMPYRPPAAVKKAAVMPANDLPPKPFGIPLPHAQRDRNLRAISWILLLLGCAGIVGSLALWPRRKRADPAPPGAGLLAL